MNEKGRGRNVNGKARAEVRNGIEFGNDEDYKPNRSVKRRGMGSGI
jgi:hypothetical protein